MENREQAIKELADKARAAATGTVQAEVLGNPEQQRAGFMGGVDLWGIFAANLVAMIEKIAREILDDMRPGEQVERTDDQ
jgi:hypothetical protein